MVVASLMCQEVEVMTEDGYNLKNEKRYEEDFYNDDYGCHNVWLP